MARARSRTSSKPKPKSNAFELARFLRRVPDAKQLLGYRLEWHEVCRGGRTVNEWFKDTDAERVTRRKFADEAAAKKYFRGFMKQRTTDGWQARPETEIGWTINPRGQRGYYNNGTWGWPKAWSRDVSVEVLTGDKPSKRAAAPIAPKAKRIDKQAIAKLVRGFRVPDPKATFEQVIAATNKWFAALVEAGLDLQPFAGADRDASAIVTSGPYTAGAIRELEERLVAPPPPKLRIAQPVELGRPKLPPSYVELLRSHGDIAVLADYRGRDATYAIAKRKGWPMRTLDEERHVLDWEIDRHGEPGSFTESQLAKRRWLRFAANAPGGSDHFFLMDLAVVDRSKEPAIYRVSDVDTPTAIDPTATVHGVKRWLVERVRHLHATVAKATR